MSESDEIALPDWDGLYFAAPDAILRSSLFAASEGGAKARAERKLENALLSSQSGYTITAIHSDYLTQSDLTVWFHVMHLAKGTTGKGIAVTAVDLLKAMGSASGTANRKWLYASIRRLSQGLLSFQSKRGDYEGSLLQLSSDTTDVDKTPTKYELSFNQEFVIFFKSGWSKLLCNERTQLVTTLAQWLHSYYSTHAKPYPVTLEKLQELSGSKAHRLNIFKNRVNVALAELKATGTIVKFEITEGKVFVTKTPSKSQAKYLRREADKDYSEASVGRPRKNPIQAKPNKPTGIFEIKETYAAEFDETSNNYADTDDHFIPIGVTRDPDDDKYDTD